MYTSVAKKLLDNFLPLITIIKECLFSSYIFIHLMNQICCMRSAHYKVTPLLLCITDLKVFCWKGDCWWPTLFMFLNLYFQSCSAGLEKFSSIQTSKKLVSADGICKSIWSFDWWWVFYSLLVNDFTWYVRWLPIFWRTTTPQLSFMLNMKAAGASVPLANYIAWHLWIYNVNTEGKLYCKWLCLVHYTCSYVLIFFYKYMNSYFSMMLWNQKTVKMSSIHWSGLTHLQTRHSWSVAQFAIKNLRIQA
jgi:hypothetical protein